MDNDDKQLNLYKSMNLPSNFELIISESGFSPVKKNKWWHENKHKDYDCIGLSADDVRPTTKFWDKQLFESCYNNSGISFANDLKQKENLATHPFFSSKILKATDFIIYPKFKHFFADLLWTMLGLSLIHI